MIIINVDFNKAEGGRLPLYRFRRHAGTPFAEIAATDERVTFVDPGTAIEGRLERDSDGNWWGVLDMGSARDVPIVGGRPPYEGFIPGLTATPGR